MNKNKLLNLINYKTEEEISNFINNIKKNEINSSNINMKDILINKQMENKLNNLSI